MEATYLVGSFVPKGTKDGEWFDWIPVAVKVTRLQKEMLISAPTSRCPFVQQALEELKQVDPDMVERYERSHTFFIVDPETNLGRKLEESEVQEWEHHGPGDYPAIDLTEVEVLRRQ